jgi:bifunctional DNase/RNase
LALLIAVPVARAGVVPKGNPHQVRMTVKTVKSHRNSFVVMLQTANGKRLLPIWIGSREAHAIQLRLTKGSTPRPMTHKLLEKVLYKLKAKVVRVEVDDLRNNVFLGKLTLKDRSGRRHQLDGRPSDLITLAVGAGLPIYVSKHVLEQAGIKPKSKGASSGAIQEI